MKADLLQAEENREISSSKLQHYGRLPLGEPLYFCSVMTYTGTGRTNLLHIGLTGFQFPRQIFVSKEIDMMKWFLSAPI